MSLWHYHIFGLWLEADRPIEGLGSQTEAPAVDVDVELHLSGDNPADEPYFAEEPPWYVSADCDRRGRPLLTILRTANNGDYALCFSDNVAFVIDRAGARVRLAGAVPSREDLAAYLLGPVLSFVLCLRNVTCLHASAVAVSGRAVAFLGPPGVGKSTTAAVFSQRGYPVLSDDLLALTDHGDTFLTQPAFPWLRLRPCAPRAFCAAGLSPCLSRTTDRQYLDLDLMRTDTQFQWRPLPLGAVYLLEDRRSDTSTPRINGVPGGSALVDLLANTWATRVLDRAMRAAEFERLGRLASRVPIRRVCPHPDPVHLPRLCEAIVRDLEECFDSPVIW